mgnify:FL=1
MSDKKEFDSYGEWLKKAQKRGLYVLDFCAFDEDRNFYGRFYFPNGGGFLHKESVKYEPANVQAEFSSLSEIPRIWLMPKVASSNIEQAGYDSLNEHLYLKFKGGDVFYRYKKVPVEYWSEFSKQESLGSFFHKSKSKLAIYDVVTLKKLKKKKERV